MKKLLIIFCCVLSALSSLALSKNLERHNLPVDTICLADPTVFKDNGMYYLYGTGSPDGFWVYQSVDLKNWSGPVGKRNGHALLKGDSYGTKGFWAPQIFKQKGKYYMAYTADEHIAIAESDSPLGPFTQKVIKAISGTGKQIDPYVFRDTDGSLYLYHVRLQEGNRIFVARLKSDLSDIEENTAKECISAEAPWENTEKVKWPVAEGPTVMKRDGLYYLFYSANDFRNIDYAVGYATASSPMGPWVKYEKNPILNRALIGQNGTGHGDFFTGNSNQLYYVFHTHHTNNSVGKRKTAIIKATFTNGKPAVSIMDKNSFQFLELKHATK
ncbi:glycoside hydrolase family 43 protein [Mucilaginibacter sp. JC4]|uniref:Glycoside hydrolase family 43 protein n=1 Tax=Mucilaginibacter aquariorum TaxID=2967225 RepID=A0ABT1T183_9SPHI|nr:glycoside hydrolase family 43 protein [Mucilaginibacter aquariorum]